MSNDKYKNIIILLVISLVFLSLSAISATDTGTADTPTDIQEVENENVNYESADNSEVKVNDNIKKNQEDLTIKNSQEVIENVQGESEEDDEFINEGDCSSSIVQKNENETAISFRLDAASKLDLYITNDSAVKQFKTRSTYFFHVLMTPNGWVAGTGGMDSGTENKKVESIAMRMINNNKIDVQSVNEIFNIKKNIGRGHFIIKAPTGEYAAIQYFYGKYTKEMGVLKSGEYIVCPNDPTYYRKGNYISTTSTTNLSDATRYLASHDRYGTLRSQITTLEYIHKNHERTINVYLANDDGRYVGCNSKRYCNDFNITGRIIKASQIPIINNKLHAATYKYRDKNIKTSITTDNVSANGNKVTLKANVMDDLSNKLSESNVIFKINGQTLKDATNKVIKAKVVNGIATYTYTLPYIWRNNFTYTAKYVGNEYYKDATSTESRINANLVRLNPTVNSRYANRLQITTNVNFISNNSKVNEGVLIYKINGVTLKDDKNNIIKTAVKDGTSTLTLDKRYSPNNYTLTVSYIRSNYRQNLNKAFTITPITTKITLNPVTTKSAIAKVTGQLIDDNNMKVSGITKACVKINGLTLKDSNNKVILFKIENGTINFDITLPNNLKAKTYNLILQTQEHKAYLATNAKTTLTVQKV
jgi:hypothetical protein